VRCGGGATGSSDGGEEVEGPEMRRRSRPRRGGGGGGRREASKRGFLCVSDILQKKTHSETYNLFIVFLCLGTFIKNSCNIRAFF